MLLDLFLSFLQIGCFSVGGGLAALPLIEEQIVSVHHWLTADEFAKLITISEMTPGPIAVNSASFVGARIAGVSGALVATLGCILPSCLIVSILAWLYTTPDGQRFRDNRLLDDKYLKTNMEELFAYEYGAVKTDQQNRTDYRADSSCLDRTDTTDLSSAQAGTVQFNSADDISDWTSHCAKYGFDIRAADTSGFERPDRTDASPECFRDTGNCRPQDGLNEVFRRGKIIEADGVLDTDTRQEAVTDDDGDESKRFDAVEAQTEMDIDWSDIAVNTAYLAADLQMMFGGTDDKKPQKKKTVRERKHGQKKKENQSQDIDFEIKM